MEKIRTTCRAKDPATCRFHNPSSIATIAQNFKTSKKINEGLMDTYFKLSDTNRGDVAETYIPAILESRRNLDNIELDYYSTPEGEIELQELIDKEEDLSKKFTLEAISYQSKARKDKIEKGENVEEFLLPSRNSLYIYPTFTKTKLGDDVDLWEGNKYNPTYTVQRIREFVKGDIKKAKDLGDLPASLKVDVKSDHKTKTLHIKAEANIASDQLPALEKRLGMMVKSYATATVIREPGKDAETSTSFALMLDIKKQD